MYSGAGIYPEPRKWTEIATQTHDYLDYPPIFLLPSNSPLWADFRDCCFSSRYKISRQATNYDTSFPWPEGNFVVCFGVTHARIEQGIFRRGRVDKTHLQP